MSTLLRRLGELLPRLEDPGFVLGEWRGGDRRDDGSYTVPYFEFSQEGLELLRALPVTVFDWQTWMGTEEATRLRTEAGAIATATAEQLVKLTTAMVRGERFTEGNVAGAFESGLLTEIVRRSRDLSESQEILRLQDDIQSADR